MLPNPYGRKQSQRAVRGSHKEGPCCDEQTKTHAPKMTREACGCKNTAAQQHANVASCGQQHHRTHKKVHSYRDSVLRARSATHDVNTVHPGEDAEGQRNQEHNPVETARLTWAAPHRQPGCSDQIEG